MHLFYTPDLSSSTYTLNEGESKHCIRVLRLTIDEIIYLIDGKGGFFKAKIVDSHPKKCKVEIVESIKEKGKLNYFLHIAIAPTKNIERLEWFIEKATEIGISEITPVICSNSERKTLKIERLEKIMVSAAKQSLTAYMPILNNPVSFNDFMKINFDGEKYIAHCVDNKKQLFKNSYIIDKPALVMIGPEGDFSDTEISLAMENNYKEISLGNSRLRTETAGIVACNFVSILNQE